MATYTRGVADSRPAKTVRMDIKLSDCAIYTPVAQRIEQRPSKPQIAGSNPVRSTTYLADAARQTCLSQKQVFLGSTPRPDTSREYARASGPVPTRTPDEIKCTRVSERQRRSSDRPLTPNASVAQAVMRAPCKRQIASSSLAGSSNPSCRIVHNSKTSYLRLRNSPVSRPDAICVLG